MPLNAYSPLSLSGPLSQFSLLLDDPVSKPLWALPPELAKGVYSASGMRRVIQRCKALEKSNKVLEGKD